MFEERIAALNEEATTMQQMLPAGKRTYTVDEIQDILGISQPNAYALIKKNLISTKNPCGYFNFLKNRRYI